MKYEIIYTPYALHDIDRIFDYIEEHAGYETARRYTRKIEGFCRSLEILPFRGVPRDDVRPGLRTIAYRRRLVVAFSIEDHRVVIHGIFQAGQDYEAILNDSMRDEDG